MQANKPDGPGWWYKTYIEDGEPDDWRIVELFATPEGELRTLNSLRHVNDEKDVYWQRVPPPSWASGGVRTTHDWRGARLGLIKGRIRNVDNPQVPSPQAPAFKDALAEASLEDLKWALNLLVTNANTQRRTFRDRRIKAIDKRIRELIGAGPPP